jgi:DNA-binding NtrC family response regulator
MNSAHTILVVDDNLDLAESLALLLLQSGHPAVASASVQDALELLDTDTSIRVVVTDVRMPGVDGLDFRRVLRHRFPKLPVVLMSGMPVAAEDLPPSIVTMLQKPFSIAALIDVVMRLP